MAYTALYRRWRPMVFDDVVGQSHITQTIKNQIRLGRIAHAYLFCGTRGTGKTSTAKIFSRAVNCLENHSGDPCNTCEVCRGIIDGSIMDVVEIDAASNNGVDNIREIRDEVIYLPARGRYKVYIIDEVHMLSIGAFNALLKTLEEPPAHVLFILATTEPHKIPATILSRCQRFDFKKISVDDIASRLQKIIDEDCIKIDNQALRLISAVSEGSLRDALSILDQCIAFSGDNIRYDDVTSVLGIVDQTFLFDMAEMIVKKNTDGLMGQIEKLVMEGRDVNQFFDDIIHHFRNLLMCKVMDHPENILDLTPQSTRHFMEQSAEYSHEKIINCIKVLSEAQSTAKWSANPRLVLEVAVIRLCQSKLDVSPEALLDRITELEKMIANGAIAVECDSKADSGDNLKKLKAQPVSPDAAVEKKKAVTKKEPSMNSKGTDIIDDCVKKAVSLWPEVIAEIKTSGKLVLFAYLTETRVAATGEGLAIIFKDIYATNKMIVNRSENIQLLEEILYKLVGTHIKVYCGLEKEFTDQHSEIREDKLLENIVRLKSEWADRIEILDE